MLLHSLTLNFHTFVMCLCPLGFHAIIYPTEIFSSVFHEMTCAWPDSWCSLNCVIAVGGQLKIHSIIWSHCLIFHATVYLSPPLTEFVYWLDSKFPHLTRHYFQAFLLVSKCCSFDHILALIVGGEKEASDIHLPYFGFHFKICYFTKCLCLILSWTEEQLTVKGVG